MQQIFKTKMFWKLNLKVKFKHLFFILYNVLILHFYPNKLILKYLQNFPQNIFFKLWIFKIFLILKLFKNFIIKNFLKY